MPPSAAATSAAQRSSEAILVDATLSGNFKGATFGKADLTGATFINANLRGAKGLSTATLLDTVWTATTCPDGTSSVTNGDTCLGHLN